MLRPGGADRDIRERHRPEETPLYRIVETCHPKFLARLEAEGASPPHFDVCLDNLARHADTTVRAINGWRRKNDRFVQRTIPDGARPLSDPATTARFFLETQFPAAMKLGTAIAHFDSVFAEVAAATEIAKDVRVWNPNLRYYRVHFGALRSVLYAVLASRTLDLPRPADAPQRFDLMDTGPLPARQAPDANDAPSATATN